MLAAPMTELEAVNDMLIGIGQLPVNAIIPEIVDQSIALGDVAFLNNRGLYVPRPEVSGALAAPGLALLVALVAVIMLSRLSRRRLRL